MHINRLEKREAHERLSAREFSRGDETEDREFYATDRFVNHLDSEALATVERVIGTLVVERQPVILDLMASWNSHIPGSLNAKEVVGLGLNRRELASNVALSEHVVHDVNKDPHLPFPDGRFDVVLNVSSVEYLTRPYELFGEVGRILKPGGLFLVVFSDRYFPPKVVKVWREANEEGRLRLVRDYFLDSDLFEPAEQFFSKGKPRPADDRYAGQGIPSDPVWAVYAEKRGATGGHRARPPLKSEDASEIAPVELERRKQLVHKTLRCPYCERSLTKWEIPQSPFCEWDFDFAYVCLNNGCPYLLRSWKAMTEQGNDGYSYRLMYVPKRDRFQPTPVPPLQSYDESRVMPRG